MKVLVTGASGFVGSTLCDELSRQGHEIKILVRNSSIMQNLAQAKFIPVKGDLRQPDSLANAVADVDIIFHVAGVVAAASKEAFFDSNVLGTKNIVEAAARFNPSLKRFVYVSSLAAGGPSTPLRANIESDSVHPVSIYGESKMEGEREALAAKEKIPVVVVRPPAVYGPRDKGVFTFFQAVNLGILPFLGLFQSDRKFSFVHVDDLVQGILAAGFVPGIQSGELFYISGDGEFSWEDAMRLIAKGLKKNAIPVRLPLFIMKIIAAICSCIAALTKKALPFTLDKMKEIEAPSWTCANAKAKEKLGFKPYWDLERGMKHTAEWYLENRWLK